MKKMISIGLVFFLVILSACSSVIKPVSGKLEAYEITKDVIIYQESMGSESDFGKVTSGTVIQGRYNEAEKRVELDSPFGELYMKYDEGAMKITTDFQQEIIPTIISIDVLTVSPGIIIRDVNGMPILSINNDTTLVPISYIQKTDQGYQISILGRSGFIAEQDATVELTL